MILLLMASSAARADSFSSWSAKAAKAERQGDLPAAMQAWTNALRLWKSSDGKKPRARAFEQRASLHEKESAPDLALKDLSSAVKLDDKNAKLFHRRGKLLLEQGKHSEAIGDFYKATALKLSFGEAFFDRARAYELQGDALFAGEDYRAACDLGYKKACPKVPANRVKKPKTARRPSKPKESASEAEETAPAASAVEIIAPVKGEKEPQAQDEFDMTACAAGIERCAQADESGTYGACVAKAKVCGGASAKGCCPGECVRQFQKALDKKSEAQAFREIFSEEHACAE